MALFDRRKKLNESSTLTESSNKTQLDMSSLFSLPYYNFIASLSSFRLNASRTMTSEIKKSMLEDATISMIINMWISDALHKDVLTHEIFSVDVAKIDDGVKDDDITRINDAIDYLLTNSNILDILPQVLYRTSPAAWRRRSTLSRRVRRRRWVLGGTIRRGSRTMPSLLG